MQIIVDKNGWLRARWLPNDSTDPALANAEIQRIDMHPLELGESTGGAHHH
jgi:hypothetical protein